VSIGRSYRTQGIALTATASVTLAALTIVAGVANADPKPSLDDARRQVAALREKAEVAGEAANDLRDDIAVAQRRVTAVDQGIAKQTKQVDAIRSQIAALAVANYQQSGMTTTAQLLLSADPDQFLTQASTARAFAGQQNAVLQRFQTAQGKLTDLQVSAQTELNALHAVQAKQDALKKELQAALDKAEKVLGKLSAAERERLRQEAEDAARRARSQRPSRTGDRPSYPVPGSGRGKIALEYAMNQLGDPYVWGADGPSSFDCSGLTMAAWRQAGVSLSHSSSGQYDEGQHVSKSELEPGDLVFYYSPIHHVAIYAGGGRIIHAPHEGASVEYADLDSMPYAGANRPG
jgi:cell wall-associated NlpC family hydrolase